MNRNDQEFLVSKIRSQYVEKEYTQLEMLREMDKKVKRPANIVAYLFGTLGAIVMGGGMSLVMTEIGETLGMADTMIPGILIGVVGLLMALINYPIYKGILGARRAKYADQIIAMSEEIMEKE